ncbi:MAG: hypothetical protein A2151_06425 [Candidatus Muproteobacteria bacterium RBG_16_65_34]|uniref:Cytochrome c domain-containing protein n=1 Tax=Candidatus Muproteobacteria bacterium RBG_16_65_34 TaxID=1817760 RepID=A0A1F6TQW4_9PROT|nr:MAG: hypothetical protein A2151_06425 [Candidatus Muproteobacteria bacterium RBG_16_65_34]
MKSLRLLLIVAAAWVSVWSTAAQATPGFARQTAKPCSACHFQHHPILNAFGREFKASGFTLKSMIPEHDDYIEADNLSIPATLNAALVTKMRYIKTNGDAKDEGTNTGEIQFPDEAAFFLGGRAGEHVGFNTEITMNSGDSNFTSFKIHLTDTVGDTRLSVIPFTTDGGGAAYGFELLNTGAQRFQRVAEERRATAAQQFVRGGGGVAPGEGNATGIALVASTSKWHVNYTLWHPYWDAAAPHKKFANYIRAAYTPTIGEWDTAVGVQLWSGASEIVDTSPTGSTATTEVIAKAETKASFLDAQAQGSVGGMPLGVYFTYGKAPQDSAGANYFNDRPNDIKAWTLLGELGVMPRLSVFLGYLDGDNGKAASNKDKRTTIGLNWMVAQNSLLQFWNTSGSGSAYDPKPATGTGTMGIMLFSGF